MAGRFHTCYSPVRRSPASKASFAPAAPRLACVRPVASVHPEPGSNSPLLFIFLFFFFRFFQLSEKYQLNSPASFAPQLSNAQIYRFLPFVFTRNHDVDSVVISFPCLSLFPCLSQSFQWPLSFLSANYSKQIRDPYHHTSFFSFAVAKVLQKILSIQTFSKLFFKFFHHLSETSPLSAHYTHKKIML